MINKIINFIESELNTLKELPTTVDKLTENEYLIYGELCKVISICNTVIDQLESMSHVPMHGTRKIPEPITIDKKLQPLLEDRLALHIWRLVQLHPTMLTKLTKQTKQQLIDSINDVLGIGI